MTARARISSEGSTGEGSIYKATPVVGRIQLLKGCWNEGLSFPLATARGHPQFLAMWASQDALSD